MPRYERRVLSEHFGKFGKKENKNSTNIYKNTIKRKRKDEENIKTSLKGESQNIALSQTSGEDLAEEGTLSQELAARCVPSELRPYFRRISDIDPELRPQNYKVIQDVFSKCQLRIMEEGRFVPLDWASGFPKGTGTEKGDDSSDPQDQPCMAWVKKGSSSLNANMYFCFHGKNILIRRILFEWFVGPTQLTEKEKEAFQKKRCRNRTRPRRFHPSCSFPECIMPEHLKATPPLPGYVRERIVREYCHHLTEDSGEEYEEEASAESPENEALRRFFDLRELKKGEEKERQGVHWLARDRLLGANERSIFILEKMETRTHKRKRRGVISLRRKKHKKVLLEDLINKPVVPLLYNWEFL